MRRAVFNQNSGLGKSAIADLAIVALHLELAG
jgi:hypothetical protein